MGVQRKFVGDDNLWDKKKYIRFSNELKEYYGLPSQAHIRYREEGRNGHTSRTLVDVCRRKPPREGYDRGNFTIGRDRLEWLIKMQGDGTPYNPRMVNAAYVVLCEEFGSGPIVNSDTAKNVMAILKHVQPYTNSQTGQEYWVVTEDFHPIGRAVDDPDDLREPPFPRGFV